MTARELVTHRIVRRARRFPDLDLDPLDTTDLSPRDAALAKGIDHIVARHWLTLAAVLSAKLTQEWNRLQPVVQAPLLVGAAQLLFMERVPDHAIVDDAVSWTKRHARVKAGGLVNAVLRRVADLRAETLGTSPSPPWSRDLLPLDDGRALRLREEIFNEDPLARLAEQTSHPVELLHRWKKAFGQSAMTALAQHNLVHPPIIVAGIEDAASEAHLDPHDEPGCFVFTGPRDELEGLLARHATARVQDPATGRALDAMASLINRPRTIIDLCAGRGTKTRQLARMFPEARIIATDVDIDRLATLSESLGTPIGDSSTNIEVVDIAEIRQFDEQADLLVVDAPCSNSGVLARRVEAKYRLSESSLEKLAAVQRQILADAIPLLAPSGKLLYITCSIEETENQRQAAWLGKWHGLRVLREHSLIPRGLPGSPPTSYMDGGYAALLSR